jgi:hypothetical protein
MWRLTVRGNTIKFNTGWVLLAMVGLTMSMAGARIQRPDDSSGEALVWVNDRPVTSARLNHAEKRLNTVVDVELSEAERLSVIDLLIDEELLLQRAESLGVVDADPGVRKAIVQATISNIVEEFLATPPKRQQLEQFYQQHRTVFERPARVAVAALRYDSLAAAQRAHASLAGGDGWADLKASGEAHTLPYLPDSPLPAHVLRRYLGPSPASVALSLKPGEVSHPVAGAGGAYLLRVTEAVSPSVPEFREIEAVVREEYLSRGREAALTNSLARLWRAADIQFNTRVVAERPGEYVRRAVQ